MTRLGPIDFPDTERIAMENPYQSPEAMPDRADHQRDWRIPQGSLIVLSAATLGGAVTAWAIWNRLARIVDPNADGDYTRVFMGAIVLGGLLGAIFYKAMFVWRLRQRASRDIFREEQ